MHNLLQIFYSSRALTVGIHVNLYEVTGQAVLADVFAGWERREAGPPDPSK